MLTDSPPRKANRAGFLESDRIKTLDLPPDGCLLKITKSIESAMKAGKNADVRRACTELLAATSEFYGTPTCDVRVLAARPLRVRENWASELFGDYNPETMLIRVWMRTAVRKEMTLGCPTRTPYPLADPSPYLYCPKSSQESESSLCCGAPYRAKWPLCVSH
jgi:hypothetical protein